MGASSKNFTGGEKKEVQKLNHQRTTETYYPGREKMGKHHRILNKVIYVLVITVLLFNSPGQSLTAAQAANSSSATQRSLAEAGQPPESSILATAQATPIPQVTPTQTSDQHSGPDKTVPVTLAPIPG